MWGRTEVLNMFKCVGSERGEPEKEAEAKDGGAPPGPQGRLAPLAQFFPVKIKVD